MNETAPEPFAAADGSGRFPTTNSSKDAPHPTDRFAARWLLLALFQLLLIILVVREFEIEKSRGLADLLSLVTGGFLAFAVAPVRFRLPLFLLLSLAVCIQVVGWQNSAWIWGLGGLLIGVCHLPLSFWLRASLLIAGAAALAWFRVGSALPFWPVLGSMFMFRLMIYLRELEVERSPASLTMRMSYFFMLPNACFPFYPIVDYRTFCQSWFAQPADQVAQRGIGWICRGLAHLLLYRAIKYYLLPSPEEIRTISDVALFLATNYMLYLRVSGAFHLVTGVLHLFGFNLPRTHDNYFLASSFNDIWRRINIYWKVFMERQFFYPAFFRLRRFGVRTALVGSIAYVFVMTWALHSYQVFWLVGEFPISTNEIVLWGLAGLFVAGNTLIEFSGGRTAKRKNQEVTIWRAMRHSLQVVGVFSTVSLFWALWTVPGFLQGLSMLASTGKTFWSDSWRVVVVLLGAVGIGSFSQLLKKRSWWSAQGFPASVSSAGLPATINIAGLAVLLLIGMPWFADSFDLKTREKIVNMQRELQTTAEASRDVQGYYEQLANVNSQADPLVGHDRAAKENEARIFLDLTRSRDDLLERELIPGWRGTLAGSSLSINRHGMRNPPISKRKPPSTYRIAVVGSSVVMGYGVNDDQTFSRLLEERLNSSLPQGSPRVEVLNFGVGQYFALHTAAALRTKVFDFDPDAVFYIAHQGEFYGPPLHIAEYYHEGHRLLYPCLDQIIQEAGIERTTPQGRAATLLQQRSPQITKCIYEGIARDCRERGILPVWIYLPIPAILEKTASANEFVDSAQGTGMEVFDLRDWAEGVDATKIKLSPLEHHLNTGGHMLAADAIFREIMRHPSLFHRLADSEEK